MRKETLPSAAQPKVTWVKVDSEHAGQRLDNFLLRLCKGVPKSHIYKAIRGGEVRINRGRVSSDYRVVADDTIRLPPLRLPNLEKLRIVPPRAFTVVFEDDALLIIDKPAGVAVHGGSGVSFGVIEQLRAARPQAKFLELAHRLDRDTSGLLMIGKKRSALLALHAAMRIGQTGKCYLALVQGDWKNERQHIRLPLLRWITASGERRVRVDHTGLTAHTIVTQVKRFGAYSLVAAELRTGRTHQIRVHLAASGFPIVGDTKYSDDTVTAVFARQGFNRMFLHAHKLNITHPLTDAPLSLEAPLPQACQAILATLES